MPEARDEPALGTQGSAEQNLSQICLWLCKLRRGVEVCYFWAYLRAVAASARVTTWLLDTNSRDQGLCLKPEALPLLLQEPRTISPAP